MAKPSHDWYLKEWLKALGKKQSHLVNDLDLNKGKVSLLVNCIQQYTRDEVNLISKYLYLEPYELLMHPDDAMAIRRLRETALKIAADNPRKDDAAPLVVAGGKRDGTNG